MKAKKWWILTNLLLVLPSFVEAKTLKEKLLEGLAYVANPVYSKVNTFWGIYNLDPRDISLKRHLNGRYDVTLHVVGGKYTDYFHQSFKLFRAGYYGGFDWFELPEVENGWKGDDIRFWNGLPSKRRHIVGLKGKIESITVEFYEKKTTPARYDALGKLIEKARVEAKLLERWTLSWENAAKIGWENLPSSLSGETKSAIMELIEVKKVESEEEIKNSIKKE